MPEKIPPDVEQHSSRKKLDEYSDLLDELVRIRKEIEQEFLPACHLSDLGQNHSKFQESNKYSNSTSGVSGDDKSFHANYLRRFYRYDLEHLEREDFESLNIGSEKSGFCETKNNDSNVQQYCKEFKKTPYQTELGQVEEKSKQFSKSPKSNRFEIKHNDYRYDDGPVLIPIRRHETKIHNRNSKYATAKPSENHHRSSDDLGHSDATNFTAVPWGLICQYENESFAGLTSNASNLSLFIGWGAIVCGVVIFARSFFVGSMIWLNYGLPVVALGAACLFLGIVLSILSDKMQHINDLKQSLTAHRILTPTTKKIDPRLTHQNESCELKDVYDRLVKLRSEINVLIDECENP